MASTNHFYVFRNASHNPSSSTPLVGIGFLSSKESGSLLDVTAEHARQDQFNEVLAEYIITAGDGELDRTYIVHEIRWGDHITSHSWEGQTEEGNALTDGSSPHIRASDLEQMRQNDKSHLERFLASCRKTSGRQTTISDTDRHTTQATISHRLTQYYMPRRDDDGIVRFGSSSTPWVDVTVSHSTKSAEDRCLRPLCPGLVGDLTAGENAECVERSEKVDKGWMAQAEKQFRAELVRDM